MSYENMHNFVGHLKDLFGLISQDFSDSQKAQVEELLAALTGTPTYPQPLAFPYFWPLAERVYKFFTGLSPNLYELEGKTELPSNFKDFVMAVRNLLIEYDLLIAFVQRLTQDVATLYSLTCKEQKLELFADTTLTASDVRDLQAHEQAKASAMRKLKKPNRRIRSRGKKTHTPKPLP